MIQYIVYFLVAFLATLLGSIIGLGGGIIIKPVLDNLGDYPVATVNFLSATTVLAMALVTTFKHQIAGKRPFTIDSGYLIIGSVIGGFCGSSLFNLLLNNFTNSEVVSKIQAVLLIIMLLFVIVANKFKIGIKLQKKSYNLVISGIIMGVIAAFLGIGGGPVNMAILLLCFGYTIKQAAMLSTITILFAQLASLLTMYVTTGYSTFDKTMLIVMIPAGVIGGILGPKISKQLDDKKINIMLMLTLIFLVGLNIRIIMS